MNKQHKTSNKTPFKILSVDSNKYYSEMFNRPSWNFILQDKRNKKYRYAGFVDVRIPPVPFSPGDNFELAELECLFLESFEK